MLIYTLETVGFDEEWHQILRFCGKLTG